MTLFWHGSGPKIAYSDGMIVVENLNPQVKTRWRMSRAEMFKLGWACIRAAMRG
jgi:hypothetical protein